MMRSIFTKSRALSGVLVSLTLIAALSTGCATAIGKYDLISAEDPPSWKGRNPANAPKTPNAAGEDCTQFFYLLVAWVRTNINYSYSEALKLAKKRSPASVGTGVFKDFVFEKSHFNIGFYSQSCYAIRGKQVSSL